MGNFRLSPASSPDETTQQSVWANGLSGAVLLLNARWFIRIRWIVVILLAGFGVAGALLDPQFLGRFGFLPPGWWPLCLAGTLALLNMGAIWWVHHLSTRTTWRGVAANIWFQITSDLVILTGLVYLIGSTTTVVSFTYLFHITMACIFFGRRDSFIVTLLSAMLFLAMVVAQCVGFIPRAGILVPGACGPTDVLPTAIFAVPTVFVWLIVWYLVSSLSNKVRQRDLDLDAANHRLIRADEETNLQMLRVAHDLKAPFSGIESSIQVLKQLHWDEMTANVRQLISKIDGRSANLRARIGDILMLGSLRSAHEEKRVVKQVYLREMLEAVLLDVKDQAEAKNISVVLGTGRMSVLGDQEQLKILFANLVSNAIVYSHDGGIVDIRLDDEATGVRVSITDHGIGISDQALPRIFEDFYRTQEAAAFNPSSTGLGLAIVRQVANNLRLTVLVASEKDKGSVFQVVFPPG